MGVGYIYLLKLSKKSPELDPFPSRISWFFSGRGPMVCHANGIAETLQAQFVSIG